MSSGSSGNAVFLEIGGKRLLIDVGMNRSFIKRELDRVHVPIGMLDGIFITHSHRDHTSGLPSLLKQLGAPLPIYIGRDTAEELKRFNIIDLTHYPYLHCINSMKYVAWADSSLTVLPLKLVHDVPVLGFYFEADDGNAVYITDTGFLPQVHAKHLYDREYYIFESNYDEDMLVSCSYPDVLKARIRSEKGHMSNEYSAHCISKLIGPHTKKVVLAHISENSNTEDLALVAHRRALQEGNFDLNNIVCAHQRRSLTVLDPKYGAALH
ncbi:MBL fold metallo-hydrolase [bacterium]|nr:MBL fold metallo-hydrolase [bacterium]